MKQSYKQNNTNKETNFGLSVFTGRIYYFHPEFATKS